MRFKVRRCFCGHGYRFRVTKLDGNIVAYSSSYVDPDYTREVASQIRDMLEDLGFKRSNIRLERQ